MATILDYNHMNDRFLSVRDIVALYGVSESSFLRWVRDGRMPAGTRIGVRAIRWKQSAIDAAIAALNEGVAA